jgi:putative heme transporter
VTGEPARRSPEGAADQTAADAPTQGQRRLWQAGRTAWSVAGLLVVLVVVGLVLSQLTLVVIPLLLALFPATLLVPVEKFLERHGAPSALASIASILGAIVLVLGTLALITTLVVLQLPDLIESAGEGVEELEGLLDDDPLGIGMPGLDGLLEAAGEQLGEAGELAPQALEAALVAFDFVAGLLIMLVVLFFYLKDGRRLPEGVLSLVPRRFRGRTRAIALRAWSTVGSYFRGQLLVALVDAVFIGIGLLVLGVPLAVPLAVLIFFGGLFPIVGAVTTGALAVLVALADGGVTTGLIVLGLILLVQQLESNVLQPLILGNAIRLHPLVVLLAITTGAVTLGVLGAFLAVPVAAVISDAIEHLRSDEPPAPPPDQPSPTPPDQDATADSQRATS